VQPNRESPPQTGGNEVACFDLDTDRPREAVRLQKPCRLPGVEFWSVARSERHWRMLHDTFTACFVHGPSGAVRGRWRSRGQERIVSAGCLQLMEPGESHQTTAVVGPASFFVVWWAPSLLESAAAELGVSGPLRFKSAQLARDDVGEGFRALCESVNHGSDALAVEHWFSEATSKVIETAAEGAPAKRPAGKRHPGVRRAMEYLTDCFREAVTLDDLAREARLSKFHLARCFREFTGLAPHQYQKLQRAQAARRFLERGASVQAAAEQAGFADGPHLTRTFREWLGVSPGAWARANHRIRSYAVLPRGALPRAER